MKVRKQKGFLLLEAMLSVALLAGGLIMIFASFSTCKKLLFQSRETFRQTLLLRQMTVELEAAEDVKVALPEKSSDEKYAFRVTKQPAPDEDLQKTLCIRSGTQRLNQDGNCRQKQQLAKWRFRYEFHGGNSRPQKNRQSVFLRERLEQCN